MLEYREFFKRATGHYPFPWQTQMVSGQSIPEIVAVPTGLGKTAGVVIAWLWKRLQEPDLVPRRLVYCLPMRVLVEQTYLEVQKWIRNLDLETESHLLLGGFVNNDWDRNPEKDSIIIGTQDMLLSKALNRGYATSRFRWPVQYALLNNDCLWVLDEVQLMGVGLQTSLQLQGLREKLGHFGITKSVWMSATISRKWLSTVDHSAENLIELSPESADLDTPIFKQRYGAVKLVSEVDPEFSLNESIIQAHHNGTLTLVVRNTVKAACETYKALTKNKHTAEILLLHSRFRKPDRDAVMGKVYSELPVGGRILVATQVVEAGVDISAKTLFTDVAPWASLVQRFGRCNRRGEFETASIYWITPEDKKGFALPYNDEDVLNALITLKEVPDAASANLPDFQEEHKQGMVLRKRDLIDLFDTTPDLAGMDIDISRFIRNTAKSRTVFVFWREVTDENLQLQNSPGRDELCRVPLDEIKKYLKKKKDGKSFEGWLWDHLEDVWVRANNFSPGMTIMLNAVNGGYSVESGWLASENKKVPVLEIESSENEANDSDPFTQYASESIEQHTDAVVATLQQICDTIGFEQQIELLHAARWHDAGKSHEAFQKRFGFEKGANMAKGEFVLPYNKFPRKGFRHELASALAMIQNNCSDLAAYLAAAHHGKVRLSIRSMPNEEMPESGARYARGVHEGDILPEVNLGNNVIMPETELSLEIMELGGGVSENSWLARTLQLRDEHGPFLLAFMETLVRTADWRASAEGGEQ